MKTTTTNRLPGLDLPTRRSELVMFLSLGAVAASLIGFAVKDGANFAAGREEVITAWESQTATPGLLLTGTPTNHAFTNLTLSPGTRNERHS